MCFIHPKPHENESVKTVEEENLEFPTSLLKQHDEKSLKDDRDIIDCNRTLHSPQGKYHHYKHHMHTFIHTHTLKQFQFGEYSVLAIGILYDVFSNSNMMKEKEEITEKRVKQKHNNKPSSSEGKFS